MKWLLLFGFVMKLQYDFNEYPYFYAALKKDKVVLQALNQPDCSHTVSIVHVYLVYASLFSDFYLCAKPCHAKTAPCWSRDSLTNQNIVTLPWPA